MHRSAPRANSHESQSQRPNRTRWLHYATPLLVAMAAFAFLGGFSGTSSLFASLDDFQPVVQDSPSNLDGQVKARAANGVAVILSHWEYTSHCATGPNAPTGATGCPSACGGGGAAVCNVGILTPCCDGADLFGPSAFCQANLLCQGCCIANDDWFQYGN